jgi:hypothetical protein
VAAASGLRDGVSANLRRLADRTPDAAGGALYVEAEIEMTEAKARTPVDTGALRGSGYVDQPQYSGREIRVELGFGGPAAGYAVIVHEDLEAIHPRGGQAKYLSSVIDESAPYLLDRVARRLNLAGLIG